MIGIGIATAAVAAFVLSSLYYAAATPLERRAVGEAALDRGGPKAWIVLTELLRTAIVASAFAWIAHRASDLGVSHALVLALIIWVGFPLVLLTGSVTGRTSTRPRQRCTPVTGCSSCS
jgi:hypothetical protein